MASAPDPAARHGRQDTPIRRQYQRLKSAYPGCILLFQLGDFYESFEDDARVVAEVCGITLTSKELGKGDRVPLAGVPLGRLDVYLARLLDAGYRVAVAEQMTPPGAGLVEREVTRVVTPGTIAEPGLLRERENNYLAAITRGRGGIGLAYVDVSTGEFATTQLSGPDADTRLRAELDRLAPSEVLVPEGQDADLAAGAHVTVCQPWRFHEAAARDRLCLHYRVLSLEGYGCGELPLALGSAGAILSYLQENNSRLLASLADLRTYTTGAAMALDGATRRNLELLRNARGGKVEGSLLGVLDRTRTPMGGRLLRRWIAQPLLDRPAIEARLDAVAALREDDAQRAQVRTALGQIGDVERAIGRIAQGLASPREVLDLADALRTIGKLGDALGRWVKAETSANISSSEYRASLPTPEPCPDVVELIAQALAAPNSGRRIRAGYSAELDELVGTIVGARRGLTELERQERERTGIKSLRVGYNRVFGYYIEITRSNLGQVPADYQRKQTLVSAERFVTPELKRRETRILSAEERIDELEEALFRELLAQLTAAGARLRRVADAIAELDVYAALAQVAADRGYVRPTLNDGDAITILAGEHPVVAAGLEPGAFIPNDCRLALDGCQVMIVTGPNMAGKSTYLREVALIVLMAQIGSFVPAAEAHIGVVDRVFTRIGAQDDIAAGASTFMVEMMESAAILRHATARSLVVLDEVGRGTSTHDGLAIAQAIVEELHDRVGARTVVATHFHELAAVTDTLPRARAFTVAVDEAGDDVVFLRRLVPGAADRSYGVHVARLAGLPDSVTARAAAILAHLDDAEATRGPGAAGMVQEPRAPFVAADDAYAEALDIATRLFDLTASLPATAALADELRRGAGHTCAAIAEASQTLDPMARDREIHVAASQLRRLGVWLEIASRCGELDGGKAQEMSEACRALNQRLACWTVEPSPCARS